LQIQKQGQMFKDIDIKFVDKEDTYAAYGQSTCCALPVVFVVFVVVKKKCRQEEGCRQSKPFFMHDTIL
jgi:hypothetical protein